MVDKNDKDGRLAETRFNEFIIGFLPLLGTQQCEVSFRERSLLLRRATSTVLRHQCRRFAAWRGKVGFKTLITCMSGRCQVRRFWTT
jgi:hypothetical protein